MKGVFFAIQKAAPILRDGGSIVINASTVAYVGTPGASLYAATKAAMRQLVRNLSMELAPHDGIQFITGWLTTWPTKHSALADLPGYTVYFFRATDTVVSLTIPFAR